MGRKVNGREGAGRGREGKGMEEKDRRAVADQGRLLGTWQLK